MTFGPQIVTWAVSDVYVIVCPQIMLLALHGIFSGVQVSNLLEYDADIFAVVSQICIAFIQIYNYVISYIFKI